MKCNYDDISIFITDTGNIIFKFRVVQFPHKSNECIKKKIMIDG